MTIEWKIYDVIMIEKLHSNKVFEEFKKGNRNIDFNKVDFIKTRPAIIIKKIGDIFIVIPLTTKKIYDPKANEMLRTKIDLLPINTVDSYLMFDALLRIKKEQIKSFYKPKIMIREILLD